MITTKTFATQGIVGHEVDIEIDRNRSLPGIDIIGLADTAIKEAKERIRSSLKAINMDLPPRRYIINLAPSDLKKNGTMFDLPITVALLLSIYGYQESEKFPLGSILFFGELGLNGSVKRGSALLPAILSAIQQGYKTFFVPKENIPELLYIPNITLYGVEHLSELRDFFFPNPKDSREKVFFTPTYTTAYIPNEKKDIDLSPFHGVKGHLTAKRALSIAIAGFHNVLLIGSPGCGKTLLSQAMRDILPPMSFDEILEVSKIYSVIGKLDSQQPLITQRPFRKVHHTASKISIVGGGQFLHPGEMSLAHKGILFFDELAEFPREVLEVLRQPLEDKNIVISRASGKVEYPADFMFVATMNPCKCGFYKDREKQCQCSLHEIQKYQGKISGPLLDRIDMILEIPRQHLDILLNEPDNEDHFLIKSKQIYTCLTYQQKKFFDQSFSTNSQIPTSEIKKFVTLTPRAEKLLKQSAERFSLSPRVIFRLIKVAQTIADLDQHDQVDLQHIAESLQYRSNNLFVQGG